MPSQEGVGMHVGNVSNDDHDMDVGHRLVVNAFLFTSAICVHTRDRHITMTPLH